MIRFPWWQKLKSAFESFLWRCFLSMSRWWWAITVFTRQEVIIKHSLSSAVSSGQIGSCSESLSERDETGRRKLVSTLTTVEDMIETRGNIAGDGSWCKGAWWWKHVSFTLDSSAKYFLCTVAIAKHQFGFWCFQLLLSYLTLEPQQLNTYSVPLIPCMASQ